MILHQIIFGNKQNIEGITKPIFKSILLYFIVLKSCLQINIRKRKLNFLWAVPRIILGQLDGKMIIIIFNLGFGTSKNKIIDHQGNQNCAYESDHISLLCDSMMPSALNVCFLSILLQPKRKRSY